MLQFICKNTKNEVVILHGKFILSEIDKWLSENIISAEQAEILKARYGSRDKKNSALIVLSTIGSLLLAAGIVMLAATGWDSFSQRTQHFISFLPLLLAQSAALAALLIKKKSVLINEGISVFYCAAVFGSYKLIDLSFNLYVETADYILICGLLIVPVFIIFKSCIASAVYMFSIIYWGSLTIYENGFSWNSLLIACAAAALVALGIFFLIKNAAKNGDFARLTALWISAAAAFFTVMLFAELSEICAPIALLLMFSILLCCTKEEAPQSPFTTAGTIGSFVMLFLVSSDQVDLFYSSTAAPARILLAVLAVTLIAVCIIRARRDIKRLALAISNLISAVTIFICSAKYSEYNFPYGIFVLPIIFLFICAALYIIHGIKNSRLTDVNIGLTAVCATTVEWIAFSEIETLVQGLVFLALGSAFIAANIILLKRQKKKSAEEADRDEK